MSKTEQAERIARNETFPFVFGNRLLLAKDEYIISHLNRIKNAVDNQETLTPYDISKIEVYYEKVMGKKYKLGAVNVHHDNKKKLRF